MLQAEITHISLCPRGKTGLKTLFKADGSVQFDTLVKADAEAGELLAVVYAPALPDADGDMADAEVIKEFAHAFMRDHRMVDVQHDLKPLAKEQAYVAESFTIAKGDERFSNFKDYSGNVVDVTGGWAVIIKLEDEALRAAYRSGAWDGVSMFGTAMVVPASKESDADEVVRQIFERLTKATNQDKDMTKQEIDALLAENNKVLLAEVTKSMNEALKDLKPKAPEPNKDAGLPVFKGDVTKKEDVATYQREVRVWSVQKDLAAAQATGDAGAIEKALVKLAEFAQPEVSDADAKIEAKDSPEVRKLKRSLYKAQSASRQPEEDGDEPEMTGVAKETREKVTAGVRIGQLVNKRNGLAAKVA
jgi:hypothetical protein